MSSAKINKLAARLFARTADGKSITLNRNDLEVIFGIVQSEVDDYERRIESASQDVKTYQEKQPAEPTHTAVAGRSAPRVWPSNTSEKEKKE